MLEALAASGREVQAWVVVEEPVPDDTWRPMCHEWDVRLTSPAEPRFPLRWNPQPARQRGRPTVAPGAAVTAARSARRSVPSGLAVIAGWDVPEVLPALQPAELVPWTGTA